MNKQAKWGDRKPRGLRAQLFNSTLSNCDTHNKTTDETREVGKQSGMSREWGEKADTFFTVPPLVKWAYIQNDSRVQDVVNLPWAVIQYRFIFTSKIHLPFSLHVVWIYTVTTPSYEHIKLVLTSEEQVLGPWDIQHISLFTVSDGAMNSPHIRCVHRCTLPT